MNNFYLPKIEVRSSLSKGIKKYIIKGYAATTGNIYPYAKDHSGETSFTFKEFFTNQAIENIKRKAKAENIWVDYGHHTAFGLNIEKSLTDIEVRSGIDLSNEKSYVKDAFKVGDVPMFKIEDVQIDDKGLFVEVHANPFYREVDPEHAKYFDSIWGSLENGFINGMSLNMKPTEFIPINSELNQINDAEVFGISLLSGASNDMANISEVAVRCCMTKRGEPKCQKMKKLML